MNNRIILNGCAPDTLIHYLKALGVFRLVAEQKLDPNVRGSWQGDEFTLTTTRTADELAGFFLNNYQPTPIVAPWNAGSGFQTKEKAHDKQALAAKKKSPTKPGKKVANFQNIKLSTNSNLALYRETIKTAEKLLAQCLTPEILALDKTKRPEVLKKMLVPLCRNELSDDCVKWFDAMCLITSDGLRYPPLLGQGGNDGNLEFSLTFMGRLHDVISTDGKPRPNSIEQLQSALFGRTGARGIESSPGQFNPGGVGGVNAGQGVAATELANPWDYVLAVEGSMVFAGAAVRRMAAGAKGEAAYPFFVQSADIDPTVSMGEKNRGELFLPLWGRPACYPEITHLFSEGRVRLKAGRLQTGVDFARAIAELGIDRGISRFQRYGLLTRNGDAHFAANLGTIEVIERKETDLFYEVDAWLRKYRALCSAKDTPASLLTTRRAIDAAIYRFCAQGNRDDLQSLLIALGTAEAEVACRPKLHKASKDKPAIQPVAKLSEDWACKCKDASTEYEMAAALAAMSSEGRRVAFRSHLEPVKFNGRSWEWINDETGVVWSAGTLAENLAGVLQRRGIEARSAGAAQPPLASSRVASLMAIDAFLHGLTDDERLTGLLQGLALINWQTGEPFTPRNANVVPPTLPRLYALLKLLFLPEGRLSRAGQSEPSIIKHEPTIVPLLRAGRVDEAAQIAERRLRASGLVPLTNEFHYPDDEGVRLAAALLIPINEAASNALAALVLRPPVTAL